MIEMSQDPRRYGRFWHWPVCWLSSFCWRAVDEAYETLSSKSVQFVKGPHDALWGARIALFRDTAGNTLQLTQIDWQRYLETDAPR